MHEMTTLSLAAAYALIGALLLGLCIGGRWPAWVKLLSILIVSGFYIFHYSQLQKALGWPTDQTPPSKFLLIAQQIIEPDAAHGSEGAIYLWAARINRDTEVEETPRSYALPYSKNLHSQLDLARAGQRKGLPQVGSLPDTDQRIFATRLSAGQVDKIKIYDLPEPALPDK